MPSCPRHVLIVMLAVAPVLARPAAAEVRLTYADMLDHLTNLDRLPAIEPGVRCKQFSSYDRASRYDPATDQYINWDANGDAGRYLRIEENGEGVMAEMEGPGCIFRIWSANPQGVIRFYLDGDTKPTYEWDFHQMFTGTVDPFVEPLVWKRDKNKFGSASSCYLPIPYAKSCKVTSVIKDPNGKTRTPGHYYIIDYREFPKDWQVETFKLPLKPEQREALRKTAQLWANRPIPRDVIASKLTLQPGESETALDLSGPGIIRALGAKLKTDETWGTRKVLLRIYWDGQDRPAVDCPIGDFFGEPRDVPYVSYPMAITQGMNWCFFPMPFRKAARVELVNQGNKPAEILFTSNHAREDVPENWAYFHAKYRQEKEGTTFDYPLIEATGTGKLVGICLYPDNIHGGWWGEGDEKVYVDGEKFPSWFGTGSEDYFGDAWGIIHFVNPSHGHPLNRLERMQGCYRWHLGDSIPFYKSFRMTIENYSARERVKNDYYSVAYWYQMPGGSDFFTEVPMTERIPRGWVVSDAIEAEDSLPQTLSTGMTVIDDAGLPQELSRGRGVKLSGKTGDTFQFNVKASSHDRFVLEIAPARDVKASDFEVLLDGKPVRKYVELKPGSNRIGIRFTGRPVEGDRCELIVDYFRMSVFRNMITNWLWIGPFENPDGKGFNTVFPPEKEIALDKTYTGRDGVQVQWQRVSRPDGIIMLNEQFTPKEHCVVYGAAIVRAPRASRHELLLGSDDGAKVWINGRMVFEKRTQRALAADSDRFQVDLKEGDNLLLIKVEQLLGDVGFAVRFLDPKDELTFALPE